MINRRNLLTGAAATVGATLTAPSILYAYGRGEFAEFVAARQNITLDPTQVSFCNAVEEAIHAGGGAHHIFFAPPMFGKTMIMTHCLPAWSLTTTDNRGIHVSPTADVANYHKYLVSRMFSSPANVDLRRWKYTSPGSALAAYRGDLVILDDVDRLPHDDNRPWAMQLFNRVTPNGALIAVASLHHTPWSVVSFIEAGNNVTVREFT